MRAQGDLQASVLHDGADRPGHEPSAVAIDVVDNHRGWYRYPIVPSSSAAAKKPRSFSEFCWLDEAHGPRARARPAGSHRHLSCRGGFRRRLRLAEPRSAGLWVDLQLVCDTCGSPTRGFWIPARVQRHPCCPLLQHRAVLPQCCHDTQSPLPGLRASTKPGAQQSLYPQSPRSASTSPTGHHGVVELGLCQTGA